MLDVAHKIDDQLLRNSLTSIPAEKLAFRNFASYLAINYPEYRFARHNMLIAKALMKVESGEINRLIVTMPPRAGKTINISEYFPAWYLGRNPTRQIIASTYNSTRAGDVGRTVRNLMIHPLHNKIFPHCSISLDSKSISKLATDQGGYYFSVGIGEAIVGRGAHLFIIDDPFKSREEVESELKRKRVFEWFQGVAYTRLMTPNAIIVVMTRWHFDDLVGRMVEQLGHENWTVLDLPAICDSEDDILGRKIGEALWPSETINGKFHLNYPLERLAEIKQTIGTREWNAQFQQKPLPTEGGLVNIDWFKKYDWQEWFAVKAQIRMHHEEISVPLGIKKIALSLDTAFKESQLNDPSAITVWGITKDNLFYLLDVINRRMAYPKLVKTAVDVWAYYMKLNLGQVPMLIEDKASGQSLIQTLKMTTKIPVIAIKADANKQVRMSSASPLIESGRVVIPDKAPWLVEYETQMARFPLWRFDDLVDSTSQFLNWIGRHHYKKPKRKFWK